MPLENDLINELKCCLSNDGHICIDPVVLKCSGSACNQCISESKSETIECFCCQDKHEKKECLEAPRNKIADKLINSHLNDFLEYTAEKMRQAKESLTKPSLADEVIYKIEIIQNEIDLRVESLVEQIHKYRDDCMKKLDCFKKDFLKRFVDTRIDDEMYIIDTTVDKYVIIH